MITIPENMIDFLYWVKERSEAYWSKIDLQEDDSAYFKWMKGAKWIGMEEYEIDQVEEKYAVKFNSEHRAFLKILHTLDRKELDPYANSFEDEKSSYFYNWLKEEEVIRVMLNWPYDTILHDVLDGKNNTWLNSWGVRPQSKIEREKIFTCWYQQAPKLLPLTSHRFIVSESSTENNNELLKSFASPPNNSPKLLPPVLSVWGSDTILYGWDLRSYLLHELEGILGLTEYVYDEIEKEWDFQTVAEAQEIKDQGYAANSQIPYWGELIEYSSGSWKYTPRNKKE